jgi:hypothetical protein
MLWSPITFRIRVSHQAQEPPSESLPTELGIRQGASWRAYNEHRPHQGMANARPCTLLPPPITDPDQIARLDVRRRQRLGGILNEYENAA